MNKKLLWVPTALMLGSSLSACSWLFGEDGLMPATADPYDEAPELAEIRVPADLEANDLEPNYPIPQVASSVKLEATFEVPRPTPLTAASQYDAVRIQRLGEQRWALVAVPPGQLWPQVRGFLTASSIGVASTDAAAGLIDTQFVKLEDHELSTRFRFRVDSGIQRNTAELHVLQQNRAPGDEPWPQASDDADLEMKMLRNVAQFIANSADAAPVSMMADQAMGDEGRIALEETTNGAQLRLELPYDRAWASTNKGLEDAGFTIDDRNRSEGVYFLTFVGAQEDEESGFFDWLWGGEEEHPMAGRKFRLLVENEDNQRVFMRIVDGEGSDLPRRDQQGLLTLLKGNIN